VQDFVRALKVPSFGRLASTYALNEIADWCASIALAVLVYAATEDALATTALFVGNRFLPAFIVPMLAAKVGSLPTARTLAGVYVLEAIVLAVLAASVGSFLLPLVVFLAFVDGTLAATARAVTRAATVALMEPRGLLREGNATMNFSFSLMNAGAPVLAGVLVAATSESIVLAFAAALFLLQAVVIAGARHLSPGEVEPAPWQQSLREGLAYVREHRFLRTILGSQALIFVLGTMVVPIEVIYAKESLGVGDVGFGALLAAWGVGMVLGSLVFARERRRPILVLIAAGCLGTGFGYLGMAAAPGIVLACAGAVVGGLGNGVLWVAVVTAVQEATEERFQARVAGLLEGLVTAAPGAGFLLGGALTSLTDPRVTIAVAGAGTIVAVILGAIVIGPSAARSMHAKAPAEPTGLAEPLPEPVG
jgi:MFS family permease